MLRIFGRMYTLQYICTTRIGFLCVHVQYCPYSQALISNFLIIRPDLSIDTTSCCILVINYLGSRGGHLHIQSRLGMVQDWA